MHLDNDLSYSSNRHESGVLKYARSLQGFPPTPIAGKQKGEQIPHRPLLKHQGFALPLRSRFLLDASVQREEQQVRKQIASVNGKGVKKK